MRDTREHHDDDTLGIRARFAALPAPPESDRLVLGAGSAADYHALAGYHYRAARPATMLRILTLRDPEPTVIDRFHNHRACLGSSHDAPDRGKTGRVRGGPVPGVVGVLVESLPALSCAMRDAALGRRYAGLDASQRGKLLNAEVRCISRVVLDPRYRGLGLAVRLVRHALATATTPYTEALAAMGLASPFFERAGMSAYPRPPHAHEARLLAALAHARLDPTLLASPGDALRSIASRGDDERRWLLRELERWYRAAAGRGCGASRDPAEHLAAAGQKLLARPVYYLHDNRDGCAMPMSDVRCPRG